MSEEGIEVPDAVWNDMERSGKTQLTITVSLLRKRIKSR